MPDIPVTDVFISYRRGDAAYAASRIEQQLQSTLPHLNVFIDREIPGGAAWSNTLDKALTDCRVVIVLIGADFVSEFERRAQIAGETDYMLRELDTAVRLQKRMIPVVLGTGDMPPKPKLPASIQSLTDAQAIFAPTTSLGAALDSLADALLRQLGANPEARQATDDWRTLLRRWAEVCQWALLVALLAVLAGEVLAWRGADLGDWPAVRRLWTGTQYVLGTALLGLCPYLAYWVVTEVRIRVGLPPLNRQAFIGMLVMMAMLLAGGGFLLLSTVRGWALDPILPERLFPAQGAGPWRYLALAAVLLVIGLSALALALWEPRLRAANAKVEAPGQHMAMFDFLCVLQLSATLWFVVSLFSSLPPLPDDLVVPVVGYFALCPLVSGLVFSRRLAATHLGRRQHSWELTALYALLGGLWLLGTLALFCDGPMRWITPRQLI